MLSVLILLWALFFWVFFLKEYIVLKMQCTKGTMSPHKGEVKKIINQHVFLELSLNKTLRLKKNASVSK